MTSAQVGINDKLNKEELEATNITMGGDHKCPVCQATFTRPQHVARHMRSHTGDRPYKCQYCGDQFARSDLLSRHVNKCHANEKPLPSQGRRKGSASASRATTSKQACDQCVQSSLPCDGSNPCAKCVQRKCRCTFVKFHRQTAPVGPGHNPRPQTQPSSSSRIPVSYPPPDDFFLAPAPSSMAETLYNSQTFSFSPLYPDPASSSDFTTKYRAQAELLRTGASPYNPANATSPVAPPSNLYPDPRPSSWVNWGHENTHSDSYHPEVIHDKDIRHRHDSLSHRSHSQPQQYLQQHSASSGAAPGTSSSYPSSSASAYLRRGSVDVDFNGSDASSSTNSQSIPSSATSSSAHLPLDSLGIQQHPHPLSYNTNDNNQSGLIQSGEGGVSNAFGSMSLDDHLKSLAAASAAVSNDSGNFFENIDMDINSMNMTGMESMSVSGMPADDPDATPMPMRENPPHNSHPHPQLPTLPRLLQQPLSQSSQQQQRQPHSQQQQLPPPVSISLPLPIRSSSANAVNNHSGISNHGTPRGVGELGSTAGSMTTTGGGGGPTDMRELKEFWKQYMRTPLSGPVPASDSQSQQEQQQQLPSPPGSGYRRPRVASTPTIPQNLNFVSGLGTGVPNNFALTHPNSMKSGAGGAGCAGGESGMRTTLLQQQQHLQQQQPRTARQAAEDLRSYEAAVMARKAPTNLNLVPKTRRGTVPAGNGNGNSTSASATSARGNVSGMSPVNVNVIHGHGGDQGRSRSGTGTGVGVVPVVNFDLFRHQFGVERPGSASTNVSNTSSGSGGSGGGEGEGGYQSHLQLHQQRQHQQHMYNQHQLSPHQLSPHQPHPLSHYPLQNQNQNQNLLSPHSSHDMNAYMMRRGSPASVSSLSNTENDGDVDHSSRASSVSVEGSRGSLEPDSCGQGSGRPSFKRLASQALGPPVVKKRAYSGSHGRRSGGGGGGGDDDNDNDGDNENDNGNGNEEEEDESERLGSMNLSGMDSMNSTETRNTTEFGQDGYVTGALGMH